MLASAATAPAIAAVRAPGKALLAGEYAVLYGAPAIVVAVDRTVRAGAGAVTEPSPFVAAACAHTAAALGLDGVDARALAVDSRALYDGERKIGLGSSAAVTVAVCGALWAGAGRSLDERQRLFAIADAAHAAAQGARGSGADVAAAVWGGALRFVRRGGADAASDAVEVTPVTLPAGVALTFVWVGVPASTADLVGRVRALAAAQPVRHDAAIYRLVSYARAFSAAVDAGDAAALLAAADGYHQAMADLGDAAGCEIVTRAHALLAALARRHGGAAKPSGAGGGDLGVAFTVGAEATAALRLDLERAGLTVLALGAPAPGLRLENV